MIWIKSKKEKEVLLEKAAKGRQILVNSQFENQASVEKYTEEARKHYQDYNNALEACSKHSRTIGAVFLFYMFRRSDLLQKRAVVLVNLQFLPTTAASGCNYKLCIHLSAKNAVHGQIIQSQNCLFFPQSALMPPPV